MATNYRTPYLCTLYTIAMQQVINWEVSLTRFVIPLSASSLILHNWRKNNFSYAQHLCIIQHIPLLVPSNIQPVFNCCRPINDDSCNELGREAMQLICTLNHSKWHNKTHSKDIPQFE